MSPESIPLDSPVFGFVYLLPVSLVEPATLTQHNQIELVTLPEHGPLLTFAICGTSTLNIWGSPGYLPPI